MPLWLRSSLLCVDAALAVGSALSAALFPTLSSWQAKYKQEYGADAPAVELDTAHWLPPPPQPGKNNAHQEDEFASW